MADPIDSILIPGTDPGIAQVYRRLADGGAVSQSFGFEEEVVFVDVETTGFDAGRHELIEIGAVIARGPEVAGRFSTLVEPRGPIPRHITRLTGITDDDVRGAPTATEAVSEFFEFAGDRDIVAHNVSFDRAFLESAAASQVRTEGRLWLDSLELARVALPRLRSHRLADLAEAFRLGEACHRALPDAESSFGLWRVCLAALWEAPDEVVTALAALGAGAWPLRSVLARLAAGRPSKPADLLALRKGMVKRSRAPELEDAQRVELLGVEPREVSREFCSDGAVGRMYPDYEGREEQIRMAEAVADAFSREHCLVVEAGTGVGKSVAYLVPAVRFASRNRVTVGVSTKTNALMDQLVHQELPALASAMDEEFTYVGLKGYSNYVCLRKLERFLREAQESGRNAATAAAVLAWVAQTPWGDIDSINIHMSREVSAALCATPVECTKKRCRFFPDSCYLHGLRQKAARSNIVVTNHALLFTNVMLEGSVLPPIRHWVVDEAHSADDVAREQLRLECERQGLGMVLRGISARTGPLNGLVARARDWVTDAEQAEEFVTLAEKLRAQAATAATVAQSLFEYVCELPVPDGQEVAEVRISERIRESTTWGRVTSVGASLLRHLASVMECGTALLAAAEDAGMPPGDETADLKSLLAGVESQRQGLTAAVSCSDDSLVYSAVVDKREEGPKAALIARVIDIGQVLADSFYPNVTSVVFTSATIAVGDDFSHIEHRLGLDRGPGGHETLRLESSYDFERQMVAYVAADMPPPGSGDYLDALGELLFDIHVAMGGSVLTLFTNRRDLRRVYESTVERLERAGLRLVAQLPGESVKRVRDEFIADEKASLFATKSFWEGFDAKGDTLRCVVVVRLPFAHPGDPLMEELRARDRESWWSKHYLPSAVLELKQAAGRLIRSSDDEGCLVITDSRIVSQPSYGPTFVRALPVSQVTVADGAKIVGEIARRFGPGAR